MLELPLWFHISADLAILIYAIGTVFYRCINWAKRDDPEIFWALMAGTYAISSLISNIAKYGS